MTHGEYNEASTATLTVFNRQGKRLGTVYLGRMPQDGRPPPCQNWLTALLTAVLESVAWRLARGWRISDAGWHPTDYFARVLSRMSDPRQPGKLLVWQRVVDYYHATLYVTKLAEALFGEVRSGNALGRRMRHVLQGGRGGLTRVLQSASVLSATSGEVAWEAPRVLFAKAYNYLHKNVSKCMRLCAVSLSKGMPIGSGVTEAAVQDPVRPNG